MLVKHARIDLPTVVDFVGHADARQNVERKILALRPTHVRMTVDPTETEPARNVGNESPVRPDKIVTAAEIHPEVMIFHAANNQLGHELETTLLISVDPYYAL